MKEEAVPSVPGARRLIVFVLYLIGGFLIFLFGSNYSTMFPTNKNAVYEWGLTLCLLGLVLFLYRVQHVGNTGSPLSRFSPPHSPMPRSCPSATCWIPTFPAR